MNVFLKSFYFFSVKACWGGGWSCSSVKFSRKTFFMDPLREAAKKVLLLMGGPYLFIRNLMLKYVLPLEYELMNTKTKRAIRSSIVQAEDILNEVLKLYQMKRFWFVYEDNPLNLFLCI